MKRWITLAIIGVALYFAWRRFGPNVTGFVTKVTS